MRKISVVNNLTLDGVMQAPGSPNEDTSDGFTHGAWGARYNDPVKFQVMGKGMSQRGALLFGRRTYEILFKAWHGRSDGNPFTAVLDNTQKYVTSNTLEEPLPWENSTLLSGDPADAVAKLKQQPGDDLMIMGSGQLIQALLRHNLIDQLMLLIHPLVLGSGHRLFADDGTVAKFKLVESVPTTTGVIIATYQLA